MKLIIKRALVALSIVLTTGCSSKDSQTAYLEKVLDKLEKIKSASYYTLNESWMPYETDRWSYTSYMHEYENPSDTIVGASYVRLDHPDTTHLLGGYDGEVRIVPYYEEGFIGIDDFSVMRAPYRLVRSPFFFNARNIIKYALTTKDSIAVELTDLGEEYSFKLTIMEDTQVEFIGPPQYIPKHQYMEDPTSIYEIWIRKSDGLPYKVRREMSHNLSEETCLEVVQFNKLSLEDFDLQSYIPAGYELRPYGQKKSTDDGKPKYAGMVGKEAPGLTLQDKDGKTVSLSGIDSKVVLINFTGIGCGPCHTAIPFLNSIRDTYGDKNVKVISVESWGKKARSLQGYAEKYNINYPLLQGTDEVLDNYIGGRGVPVFFILDEKRIIRNAFNGYIEKITDKEISDAIEGLLQ